MRFCKECQNSFDDEKSKLTLTELSKINYDARMISDANDLNFCGKMCEKKHCDRDYEKVGGNMVIVGGSYSLRRKALSTISTLESGAQSDLVKDRILFKHITEGKASDKSITRDATAIEVYKQTKKKTEWKESKIKSIEEKRGRFKAKYGYDPG